MKNKTKIALIVVLLAALIGGGTYAVVSNKDNDKKTAQTTSSSETKTTESSETKTTESSDENKVETQEYSRKGAVSAITDILKELQKAPDGKMSLKDRLDEVSKENYDKSKVFTDKGWELLHLPDFMSTDPRGEVLVAQSMLSVLNAIEEAENKDIKAADVDLEGVVLFDKDLNMAFIPVDLYTNAPTKLSFEMVYKDSHWVFQPYTLVSQIAIRTTAQGVINQTPEGKKVLTEEQKEEAVKKATTNSSSDEKKSDKETTSSDSK